MNRRNFLGFSSASLVSALVVGRTTGVAAASQGVGEATTPSASAPDINVQLAENVVADIPAPIRIGIAAKETTAHIRSVQLFAPGNPLPDIAHFVPRPGSMSVDLRWHLRLPASTTLGVAVRTSDGACHTRYCEVKVASA